jgi:hypothetical protein
MGSNITGGIEPGTEADYTHGQTLNRGFIDGQNPDVWPDIEQPQGQYLPSWRPSGGFPQQGLDPVASTPTYDEEQWMPSWRAGGGFPDSTVGGGSNLSRLSLPEQVSGFPSGGMADFRSFTPGGGFRDDDSSSTGSLSFDDRWSGVNMRTGQDTGPSGTLQDWRFNLPTSYDQGAQDETFDTGPSGTAPEWRNRIAATMIGGGSMQYDQGAQDETFDTGPSGYLRNWGGGQTHYDQGAQDEVFDAGARWRNIDPGLMETAYANQPGGFTGTSHLSLPGGSSGDSWGQNNQPIIMYDTPSYNGGGGGSSWVNGGTGGGGFNPTSFTGGGTGYQSPGLANAPSFNPATYAGGGTGYQSPSTNYNDSFALANNLGTTGDPGFAAVALPPLPPLSAPPLTGAHTNWEMNPNAFTPTPAIMPGSYQTSTGNYVSTGSPVQSWQAMAPGPSAPGGGTPQMNPWSGSYNPMYGAAPIYGGSW